MALSERQTATASAEYRRFLSTVEGARLYQRFQKLLYSEQDSLVQALLELVLLPEIPADSEAVTICDVGCGDGRRTAEICRGLGRRAEVQLVEQSPVFAEDVRRARFPTGCRVELFDGRFEEFSRSKRFDIVLVIHSIFGMNRAHLAERLLALLSLSGVLVIASNAGASLLGRLKQTLDGRFESPRVEVDEVKEQLSTLGVGIEIHSFGTRWSVPEERFKEVAAVVGQWLGLGSFEDLSLATRRAFMNELRRSALQDDGALCWQEAEEVVVVRG